MTRRSDDDILRAAAQHWLERVRDGEESEDYEGSGLDLDRVLTIGSQRVRVLQAVDDAKAAAKEWDDAEGGTNHLVGGLLGILGCDDLVDTGATRMPGKHREMPLQ